MFNLPSPHDQVSNCIVKHAYFGKKLKLTFKFRLKQQCYGNKIKYKLYNPFTKGSFDLLNIIFNV